MLTLASSDFTDTDVSVPVFLDSKYLAPFPVITLDCVAVTATLVRRGQKDECLCYSICNSVQYITMCVWSMCISSWFVVNLVCVCACACPPPHHVHGCRVMV